MVKLVHEPINPATVYNSVCTAFSGSALFHYAIVKKQACSGKTTTAIEYSANEKTLQELEEIAAELKLDWELEDMLLIRRVGTLNVGEIISLVAASSPNSDDSFAACKCAISRLKKMSSITKRELFAPTH